MAEDSLLKESGITAICIVMLTGIGYGLKWIGQKIWDMLLGQIKERIEQMDKRIESLEKELEASRERECRFYDCPEGRPCAKIVRSFTIENHENKHHLSSDVPESTGDGSVVIRKNKK